MHLAAVYRSKVANVLKVHTKCKICPNCPFNCDVELKAAEGPSAATLITPDAGAISRLSGGNITLAFPYLVASKAID